MQACTRHLLAFRYRACGHLRRGALCVLNAARSGDTSNNEAEDNMRPV